jgi:hypothetical protein
MRLSYLTESKENYSLRLSDEFLPYDGSYFETNHLLIGENVTSLDQLPFDKILEECRQHVPLWIDYSDGKLRDLSGIPKEVFQKTDVVIDCSSRIASLEGLEMLKGSRI